MNDVRDRETLLQMVIRNRIESVENLIKIKNEDIAKAEQELTDPKYNYIFVQVGKSHDMGYKQGLEHSLITLKEIQNLSKKGLK